MLTRGAHHISPPCDQPASNAHPHRPPARLYGSTWTGGCSHDRCGVRMDAGAGTSCGSQAAHSSDWIAKLMGQLRRSYRRRCDDGGVTKADD
jgi:hypothetical protein